MRLPAKLILAAVAAVVTTAGPAFAQQKLKWAHVYEASRALSHGVGVGRRRDQEAHQRQVRHRGLSGQHARQGNRHQQGLTLGTVDMIISGPSFAARNYPRLGIAYYPFIFRDADHLLAYSKSAVFTEMVEGYRARRPASRSRPTRITARGTLPRKSPSPIAPA